MLKELKILCVLDGRTSDRISKESRKIASNIICADIVVTYCLNCPEIAEFCCSHNECKSKCFCEKCYKINQQTEFKDKCPVCKKHTVF